MLPDSVVGPLKTQVERAVLDAASKDDAINLADEINALRSWLGMWERRVLAMASLMDLRGKK